MLLCAAPPKKKSKVSEKVTKKVVKKAVKVDKKDKKKSKKTKKQASSDDDSDADSDLGSDAAAEGSDAEPNGTMQLAVPAGRTGIELCAGQGTRRRDCGCVLAAISLSLTLFEYRGLFRDTCVGLCVCVCVQRWTLL